MVNDLRARGHLVIDPGQFRGKLPSYDLVVILDDGPDGGAIRVEVKSVHPGLSPGSWFPRGSYKINRAHTLNRLWFHSLAVVAPDGSYQMFPSLDGLRRGEVFHPSMVRIGVKLKHRERKAAILKLQQPLQFNPEPKDS